MQRYKLTIAYDGTAYAGWQRQRQGEDTIQARLEAALRAVTGQAEVAVTGAGRTDAGVHALAQVAHVDLDLRLPPERLPYALNAHLPDDIVVRACEPASPGFHARKSAAGKVYRYTIFHGPFLLPFWVRYACHWRGPLDLDAMRAAAQMLTGEHDFAAFRSTGSSAQGTVRRIYSLDVTEEPVVSPSGRAAAAQDGGASRLIHVTAHGNGFLYNMVRIIAGTLLEVGAGRRPLADVAEALRTGRRDLTGKTLPPQGLCLMRVDYCSPRPSSTTSACWPGGIPGRV